MRTSTRTSGIVAALVLALASAATAQETAPAPVVVTQPAPAPAPTPKPCTPGDIAPIDTGGLATCQGGKWRPIPPEMLRNGLGDRNWWDEFVVALGLIAIAMYVAYWQTERMPSLKGLGTYLMVGAAVAGAVAFAAWQYTEGVSPIVILMQAGVLGAGGSAVGGAVGLRRAVARLTPQG